MRKRGWAVLGVGALLALGGGAAVLFARPRGGPAYPTTPEGWVARWHDAAAEFGRTPGEGWDRLELVRPDLESGDPDRVAAALDGLRGVVFTAPVPPSPGRPHLYEELHETRSFVMKLSRGPVRAELRRAIAAGDFDAVAACIERAWVLARIAGSSGTISGGLLGSAIVEEVLWVVRPSLRAGAGSEPFRRVIAGAPVPDLAWTVRMERELGLAAIRSGPTGFPMASDQAALFESAMTDGVAAETAGDARARERVDRLMTRLRNDTLYSRRRPLLDITLPDIRLVGLMCRAASAERDATLVMIALERWRDAHGSYPDTLDRLVPDLLDRLPDDLYAASGPLRYRVVDPASDDPAAAYLLYSVGADGEDDGGEDDPGAPGQGLRKRDHTGDHVFNRPPPDRPRKPAADDEADDAGAGP